VNVVGGLPVHHYRAEDAIAEAYAMVFLVASGIVLRAAQGVRCGPIPVRVFVWSNRSA